MRAEAPKSLVSRWLWVLWVPARTGTTILLQAPLAAQPYPSKPVRIIVLYPPGGSVDVVACVVGRKLADTLRQPVIVENRGGALGALGTDIVAKAPPDGYTIGLSTSTLLMAPALQKVPYVAIKDFAPVILFATVSNILVVHPSLPAKSLQDLIRLARARPGASSYDAGDQTVTGTNFHEETSE